jgi:hypothetical protein
MFTTNTWKLNAGYINIVTTITQINGSSYRTYIRRAPIGSCAISKGSLRRADV